MMHYNELAPAQASALVPHADRLRLAAAAYLARFKGTSRDHASSDLRCYLTWCAGRGLDPFLARRPHLELYIRWMQEVRRFKPSTVSRRFSVVAGFYRTCVIDGVLEHSPAEHVRRPAVPAGVTDARFHAPAVRGPAHRRPRVRQPERLRPGGHARPAGPADPRSHQPGHRRPRRRARPPVLRVCGKGSKVVLVPLPPSAGRATGRAISARLAGPILLNTCGARMDRHAATRRLRRLAEDAGVRITRPHPHMLRHTFVTTMLGAGVDLRDVQIAARHADPRTTMRYDRACKNLGRHPNYILAACMASGT
jgi:integrase/recombinase XerD